MRTTVVWALGFGAIAAVACSHEVDGTTPSAAPASAVAPSLVCVEQLTTDVVLHGDGFGPMPTDTLKKERLVLPAVVLNRVKGLDGSAATESFSIPDDPANPAASHVHWNNPQQMSFQVYPDLKVLPGLYDIRVTNPDGKNVTFAGSLTAVPRPNVTEIIPPAICDDQSDQTIVVNGGGFLQVGSQLPEVEIGTDKFTATKVDGCSPLIGSFPEPVQTCTSISITVPKQTFGPGDYPVTVTNPGPAACKTTETISLHDEPPPTVMTVVPGTVCTGGSFTTVNGTGFLGSPTVTLQAAGKATVTGKSTKVNSDGTQLTTVFGGGAELGATYDVVVQNPDGCVDAPPPHKTVTVVDGPIAYLADPEVVYNGVNMSVTIYVTSPGTNPTVQIVPAGQSPPGTSLTIANVTGHKVQVTVPKGTAPGTYDVYFANSTGCTAILPNAITVTHDLTITIKSMTPSFGWTSSDTAVTIFRDTAAPAPGNKPFVATPRAFLNPHNATATDVATPLESVAFGTADKITAVVPKNTPAKTYDLVVTNPDGTVGFKENMFTVTANAPPVVNTVTPSSIVAATNQQVTIAGTDFRTGATVTLSCTDNTNATITPTAVAGAPVCSGANCTMTATIDGSGLTPANVPVCVLRVTNLDGTFGEYSAIGATTSALNLEKPPKAGTDMNDARRALVASAGDATLAARFVYAIGGDTGTAGAATPFNNSEFASVDVTGVMGPWARQRYDIGGARSFAAGTKFGRYTYLIGGTDGGATLNTVRRAMILDPRESPRADIDDLVLAPTGLDTGYWYYRVAATFDATNPDNPGGDSLASDEVIVKLPSFPGKKIQVKLAWTAPVDSLGAALPLVSGYKVYRTSANGASGGEVLLATISGAANTTFTDDGTMTVGTEAPLPLGSMGKWFSLANLNDGRKAAAAAAVRDPGNAQKLFVYALLGLDGAGALDTSYELLSVDIATNGHQSAGGAWTKVASTLAGRQQLGAWVADASVSTVFTGTTADVYVGGGISEASASVPNVDVGVVTPATGLLVFSGDQGFNGKMSGYGICAANKQLFTFGGGNAAPSKGATSASITKASPAPTLAANSWNSEGLQMLQPRYLLGSSVQSAFIFLVGGDVGGGTATKTTELVIW